MQQNFCYYCTVIQTSNVSRLSALRTSKSSYTDSKRCENPGLVIVLSSLQCSVVSLSTYAITICFATFIDAKSNCFLVVALVLIYSFHESEMKWSRLVSPWLIDLRQLTCRVIRAAYLPAHSLRCIVECVHPAKPPPQLCRYHRGIKHCIYNGVIGKRAPSWSCQHRTKTIYSHFSGEGSRSLAMT